MSGDVDHEDKTEEPTEKRLHDAVEKGQIAFSREAPLFASLSAALVALVFVIPGRSAILFAGLVGIFDDPAGWRIARGEDALALAGPLASAAAEFLWPVVALLSHRGRCRLRRPGGAAHRARPHHAGLFAHLAASRIAARLRRAWARRVRQEPDQGRRGRIASPAMMLVGQRGVLLTAMDDDPGGAAPNASSRWPSGRSRRFWSRPSPSRARTSSGRASCGVATTG